MKITVTGGAGFIGSHLVEKLLDLGHTVINIDNLSTGKRRFIQDFIDHPNHAFVEGTTLDRDLVRDAAAKSDVIFHLAAVLGVKNCVDNPLKVIEENIDGTRIILEEAYKQQVKVVFASTSEVYGKNDTMPFSEDADRVLGATAINRWSYATAKALDEHLCFAYMQKGLPVTIVRYFNAYGPRATSTAYGGVLPRFITAAMNNRPLLVYGSGKQQRCFTYIDDTVRGTIMAADKRADGYVFNLGSHFETSIEDLAYKIRSLLQSSSEINLVPYEKAYGKGYEDIQRRVPDLTKVEKILGYKPKVELEHGLLKTMAWYLSEEGTRI